MKQILQSYRSGELWLADVPAPACKAGGVVIRTTRSVVSAGTEKMLVELARKSLVGKAMARPDLVRQVLQKVRSEGLMPTFEKVLGKLDTPVALGYSAAGVVVEAGRGAGFQPGERLAVAGAGYAGHAEYNFVPRNLCARIPDGVSDEEAAFATIGAIALQGVRQTEPRLGEVVAVVGLGLLGLLTVQLLKANGCAVVGVDLSAERCRIALEMGADAAVTEGAEDACAAVSGGRGADAVIVAAAATSSAPIALAAELCRQKGRVVVVGMVGMDLPRDPFYKKELDLRLSMSYGPGRYDSAYEEGGQDYPFAYVRFTEQRNLDAFLYLVQQGRVTPSRLVTHRFPMDEALTAYQLLEGTLPADSPIPRTYMGLVIAYDDAAETPVRRVELPSFPWDAVGLGAEAGVGFVGLGNFGKGVLLPAFKRAGARLTGLCTATGMSAAEGGKRGGFAYGTTDLAELLGDAATAGVVIATRHGSHASMTTRALDAGRHVFVEKPLCIRPDEIDDVRAALERSRTRGESLCLTVGYNRRFSPHAALLRDVFAGRSTPLLLTYRVNAGAIPRESWIQDPDSGGGRIVGEVGHFIDLCSALVGADPVRVHATSIATADARLVAEDSVVITLSYPEGSVATIQYLAVGSRDLPKERLEAHAGGVSAVLDDFRTTTVHGVKRPNLKGLKGAQRKGFDEEVAAFLACVRAGGPWPIPWDSLERTSLATFGALESLSTGRVVALI